MIAAAILLLFVVHRILERGGARAEGRQFRNQLVMFALSLIALLVVVVALPVSENLRGQLLAFFGILLSAAIALASTTLLGNALAGIMLKGAIRNFRMGDFIRCGEHFGRVSERGLLHTEIQTADRDLVTMPNLYLVSHPVKTVRGSGTIVSSRSYRANPRTSLFWPELVTVSFPWLHLRLQSAILSDSGER